MIRAQGCDRKGCVVVENRANGTGGVDRAAHRLGERHGEGFIRLNLAISEHVNGDGFAGFAIGKRNRSRGEHAAYKIIGGWGAAAACCYQPIHAGRACRASFSLHCEGERGGAAVAFFLIGACCADGEGGVVVADGGAD